MGNEIKNQLKQFCIECKNNLNNAKITAIAGKYNLGLSTRTLSDIIEKHAINFAIDFFSESVSLAGAQPAGIPM